MLFCRKISCVAVHAFLVSNYLAERGAGGKNDVRMVGQIGWIWFGLEGFKADTVPRQ